MRDSQKLVRNESWVRVVQVERVNVDEDDGDEPEEGEGVELKKREEGEPQHLQKVLVPGLDVFVEQAAGERRLAIVYL